MVKPSRATASHRVDRGFVLIAVLLSMAGLLAVSALVVPLVRAELAIARNFRTSAEADAAAFAAANLAIADLDDMPNWSAVLQGASPSRFFNPLIPPSAQTTVASVGQWTNDLQARTNAASQAGPDTPRWALFLGAAPGAISAQAVTREVSYLAAWVADDPADGDGRPDLDANGRVIVQGRAIGAHGTQAVVIAVVERVAPGRGGVRVLRWSPE